MPPCPEADFRSVRQAICSPPVPDTPPPIRVNRAPVLTLWATVDAERRGHRRGASWRARRMTRHVIRRMLILGGGAISLAGCGYSQPPTDRFYPPQELSGLVTGRTMQINASAGPGPHMLIYLAPDGTGWLDIQFGRVAPPQVGSMSMLTNWYLAVESQVCATASPRIGDMPNFSPASLVCVQVLRPGAQDVSPTAVVWPNGRYQALPLALYPFNAFPDAEITQYRRQVSVLFGGYIPIWSLP
jgi:hypothetical protein